jgi:hypothetical protein
MEDIHSFQPQVTGPEVGHYHLVVVEPGSFFMPGNQHQAAQCIVTALLELCCSLLMLVKDLDSKRGRDTREELIVRNELVEGCT